jgi:cell wall-associated NlpC family hydrolase
VKTRVIWTAIPAALLLIALLLPAIPASGAAQTHLVQPGDTLWSIARRHGVSVDALVSANRLANPDALRLGQQIIIPGAAARIPSSASRPAPLRHVVVAGDTLWSLAQRYRVPVDTIVKANELDDPDALRLGQMLLIPVTSPVRPSISAPTGVRKPTGSGGVPNLRPTAGGPSRGAKWGSALLATSARYVGVRYRWGGMSPRGFDCSGFIGYVMRVVGVSVPRTTGAMWSMGRPIDRGRLQVGDIVFFTTTRPGPSHAGIYVGNNQFVHASSGFGRVTVTSMDYRYYKPRYLGARRF